MKRSGECIRAGGCLSALLAAGIAFANEDAEPRKLWVNAPITVDAGGQASIGKIDGAKGALAEVIRAELVKARYLPASRDGQPVASKMRASANVVLTPMGGGDYTIKVDSISLAPSLRTARPPRYPMEMVARNKSGYVMLELTVGADGRVIRSKAVDATDPAFSKEVLAVAKGWRFESASIDGSNFEYVVTLPVWFQGDKSDQSPKFVCRWDERRPRWKQQREQDCLDSLHITFRTSRASTGL